MDAISPELKEQISSIVRDVFKEEAAALETRLVSRAPIPGMPSRVMLDAAREAASGPQERRSHGIGYDPFEGKGLDFVRFVKAHAVAKTRNADPALVAKRWGYDRVADVISKGLDGFSPEQRAVAMTEQVMADGGALAPDEFSAEFIELLRAATVVRSSGARVVPMNSGSLTMGRQNSAGTASYQGEDENIATSKPTVGTLQATARKLTALTPISNDLIRDASISAETLVRDDLVAVMALKEDVTFIRSVGTQYQPKGLLYWTNASNKFNATQAGATATVAEVMADLTKMLRLVDESNVNVDLARSANAVGWLMTPRTKWFLFGLLDANSNPVFRDELRGGKLLEHPVKTTTQIPNNLGGGTNESEVYFGVFNQAIIAENTALLVDAFPGGAYHDGSTVVSGISKDQTVIRTIARHDLIVRHDNCFAVLQAVKWGA